MHSSIIVYLNTQVSILYDHCGFFILFPVLSALNFTIREHGIQIDQPPAIGNISTILIVIQKNDNIEGILEFDSSYINITGMHIHNIHHFKGLMQFKNSEIDR